jgi:hypothetical protein
LAARLSSEGDLSDYKIPDYRYYPKSLLAAGTRDWSRVRFLQACEKLNIPYNRWPDFEPLKLPGDHHYYMKSPVFPTPAFDLLQDSATQWRENAEHLFREHCDDFLKKVSNGIGKAVTSNVLMRIERPKDSGSPLALRYEWAARRYCYNEAYKDLATNEHSPEKVRKAVTKIFSETDIWSVGKRKEST